MRGGREAQEPGDICILVADSLPYPAETNNIVKEFHPPPISPQGKLQPRLLLCYSFSPSLGVTSGNLQVLLQKHLFSQAEWLESPTQRMTADTLRKPVLQSQFIMVPTLYLKTLNMAFLRLGGSS